MNKNILKIEYNPSLMINEVKNLPLLMEDEIDNDIRIYKFILYSNEDNLTVKAMINESLIETLSPLKELVEVISYEIIYSYDLYSLNNLDLNLNKEIFSLHLEHNAEKNFQLLIVLNPDYIQFFDKNTFDKNNNLNKYINNFNEVFNNILLNVYELLGNVEAPIIISEYELILKRNDDNEWTYFTFIRTMLRPINKQKEDIEKIINSLAFTKIIDSLDELIGISHSNECFIKLNYNDGIISNVRYCQG